MEAIFTPTILVVDDEKNIRDALYKILSKEGYKIITAEDSNTALEILRSNQIDLILSDLKMPQIDGVEFLKIVKYNFPESEFILITAYGSVEEAVKAMKHGAFDFILKPLKKAAIIGIVKNALEKQFVIRESKDLQKRIKDQVIGESLAFRQVMEMVKRVAPSSA
ncbi:MAG: response regulator, partial [Thermodesulfobacteriota bacterium]|nr:response regulator [Thermodesulfobacteriota bacterium]